MKKYEIVGRFIELHEGVVQVTASQAKRRSVSLAQIGDDLYRIGKPVQFKAGEIIGIDYDPPKSLANFMRLIEEIPEAVEPKKVLQQGAQVEELPESESVIDVTDAETKTLSNLVDETLDEITNDIPKKVVGKGKVKK